MQVQIHDVPLLENPQVHNRAHCELCDRLVPELVEYIDEQGQESLCCAECADSMPTCGICGMPAAEVTATDHLYDSYTYKCPQCLDAYYDVCEICLEWFPKEQLTYVDAGAVCPECIETAETECAFCGERLRLIDAIICGTEPYCADCAEQVA